MWRYQQHPRYLFSHYLWKPYQLVLNRHQRNLLQLQRLYGMHFHLYLKLFQIQHFDMLFEYGMGEHYSDLRTHKHYLLQGRELGHVLQSCIHFQQMCNHQCHLHLDTIFEPQHLIHHHDKLQLQLWCCIVNHLLK